MHELYLWGPIWSRQRPKPSFIVKSRSLLSWRTFYNQVLTLSNVDPTLDPCRNPVFEKSYKVLPLKLTFFLHLEECSPLRMLSWLLLPPWLLWSLDTLAMVNSKEFSEPKWLSTSSSWPLWPWPPGSVDMLPRSESAELTEDTDPPHLATPSAGERVCNHSFYFTLTLILFPPLRGLCFCWSLYVITKMKNFSQYFH